MKIETKRKRLAGYVIECRKLQTQILATPKEKRNELYKALDKMENKVFNYTDMLLTDTYGLYRNSTRTVNYRANR